MKKLNSVEVKAMLDRGVFCQKYDYATGKWVDQPPPLREA